MPEGNGAFTGDVQVIWDSTSLSLAETCARKYYYTMIAQITGKDPSVHLRFGGLYATALETYYKVRAKEKLSHDEAVLLVVKDTMLATWDREKGQPEIFLDNKKTRMNLIRTIVWYLDEYGEETESSAFRTHYKSDGVPAVELSFKFQISPDLTLSGHLDRVVSYAGEGLYVMDQKTTGTTLSPHFFNSFSPNTQMSLYTWAGQIILNSPVRGVVIDAAQIAVGFSAFLRGFTYRTEEQLDEWLSSAHHTIRMIQDFSNSGYGEKAFPMNPASCGNYGGCVFRSLCSTTPRYRERMIRDTFTKKIWDPSKER
jgi:hypothetical protein